MSENAFITGEWESADGLVLHYRDYPGRDDRPPILCIPGLTRNARDFEPVADAFAGEWRVICPDLRGRGQSAYAKDPASYSPETYVEDLERLFEQAQLPPVVVLGTSLGGLLAMLLTRRQPSLVAAVALNDAGPVLEPAGLARVREYVGQGGSYPTWMHAARALREQAGVAHPDYAISDWLRLSKRLMRVGGNGRINFDYDMKIAEPFMAAGLLAAADAWPLFRGLAGRPALILRGDLSDMVSPATLRRMAQELPDADIVTVPRTGHAPTLEEPEAQAALARLLTKLA